MKHANWKAKLTKESALEAYDLMHNKGFSCGMAAMRFKVARTTMASLRCGKPWSWLTGGKNERSF